MLRLRSSARFALPFAALVITTACVDNGRSPELSEVDPIGDATPPIGFNVNIPNPTLTVPDSDPIDPGDDLVLIFSDEFDGPTLDPQTWFFATGRGEEFDLPPGWGNDELQYYLPDNAQIEGGVLKITAKRESFGGQPYTSARINTRDRFAFRYGRIEASIKLPAGQGIWPAFWMLAQDSPYGIWGASGEIDIVEAVNLGGTPRPDNPDADGGGNKIFGTIYYGGEFPNQQSSSETYVPSVDVSATFNTYAVEWDVNEIRWYFNDTLYATQNSWFSTGGPFPAPFDNPFYILLNVAVGGNFPGFPDADTEFPAAMEVDYVRVYKGEAPPPPPNHGTGTAGVYTETLTESPITVTGITNSIDFTGNNTVADPMSTAIPAFEGDNVLSIDYQNSGSTFGGALLNFGGVDLTAYDTLNFTIDTSAVANFADLTIQIEPPGAGAAGTNVALSAYMPVAMSGDWATYQIPLADFNATNFAAAANLGFWNARDGGGALVFGTLYVDDVYFSTEGTGGMPPVGHGMGTGGVFTETMTESTINVAGIINSADFTGNNTPADPMSTAIPAFEGNVSLSIDYQDSSSTFGGALLDFGGVDLTAFDTLNFTIDTSAVANLADLTIQIEPPGAGAAGTNVALSAYTPVATSGNWESYQIPLADFTATTFSAAANLGFWNARDGGGALVFGTIYVDDIYFSTENTGGGGSGGNLVTNGDLETGDETGWTNFPNDGTIAVSTDNPSSGTYSLNLNVAYAGGGAPAPAPPTAKFERIAVGTVQANQALTISFDIRGTITQPGAAFFIEFFTETAMAGPSSQEFLSGGPLTASITNWETQTYNVTTGADASGGITLQFVAACGNVDGCAQDMYIDNVSITID